MQTHTMKYALMACILVTAAFGFEISNIGHVLPLQADYEKSKIVLHEFFLHKYDLKMDTNNFLVGSFLIQISLVLDLP